MLGYEIVAQGRNLKIMVKAVTFPEKDTSDFIKWLYETWNEYIEEVLKTK